MRFDPSIVTVKQSSIVSHGKLSVVQSFYRENREVKHHVYVKRQTANANLYPPPRVSANTAWQRISSRVWNISSLNIEPFRNYVILSLRLSERHRRERKITRKSVTVTPLKQICGQSYREWLFVVNPSTTKVGTLPGHGESGRWKRKSKTLTRRSMRIYIYSSLHVGKQVARQRMEWNGEWVFRHLSRRNPKNTRVITIILRLPPQGAFLTRSRIFRCQSSSCCDIQLSRALGVEVYFS